MWTGDVTNTLAHYPRPNVRKTDCGRGGLPRWGCGPSRPGQVPVTAVLLVRAPVSLGRSFLEGIMHSRPARE